jgi:hypothetical protein
LLTVLTVVTLAAYAFAADSGNPGDGSNGPSPDVRVEFEHLRLSRLEDGVGVYQVVRLLNGGDTGIEEYSVTLPNGAADLQLGEGLSAVKVAVGETGFTVQSTLGAGEEVLLKFSYRLPASDYPLELTKEILYDTDILLVLVDEADGLDVTGEGIKDTGFFEMGQKRFRTFQALGLSAGETLTLSIEPGGGSGAVEEDALPNFLNKTFHGGNANVRIWKRVTGTPGHWGMPGIIAIGLVLLVLLWFVVRVVRARLLVAEMAEVDPYRGRDPGELLLEKERLIEEIARLDQNYEAGRIEKEKYLRIREKLKRRLVRIMLAIKDKED